MNSKKWLIPINVIFVLSLIIIPIIYLIKIAPSQPNNEVSSHDVTLKPAQRNGTTFNDLYDDILFLIFDCFDWEDLLNVTKVNSNMSSFAEYTFRRKYGDYAIDILMFGDGRDPISAFISDSKYIDIPHKWSLGLDLIEHFGHLINELNIGHLAMEPATKYIEKITKYGDKTLKRLHIKFIQRDILQYFNVPFERLENLKIEFAVSR